MEVKEFGREHSKKILLIPGCMMCWKQFDRLIPYLAKRYHVIAVSTDSFDGTGRTGGITVTRRRFTAGCWSSSGTYRCRTSRP